MSPTSLSAPRREVELLTLDDLDVESRRVLLRADLNVPLEYQSAGGSPSVGDDNRIRAALETIEELRRRRARIVLVSHLGRPVDRDPKLSMRPVAGRLTELTGAPIRLAPAVVGVEVQQLAAELAELADVYVNDAFGAAHRAHASTEGIAHRLPRAAGRLMEREVQVLSAIVEHPDGPLVAILGGAKVSDKIGVIERFLQIADVVCIGGAMCFPFLAAQGHGVGDSVCAEADIEVARQILEAAAGARCRLELPVDLVIAEQAEWGRHTGAARGASTTGRAGATEGRGRPVTLAPGPEWPAVGSVCLIVMDGWGVAASGPGNAIALARTPVFDELWDGCAHSLNPVPLIVTARGIRLAPRGSLADVAPTVLALLRVEQPAAMTGRSLLA